MIDALYLWRMPRGNSLGVRLRRYYELTEEEGGGQLFERRRAPRD